MTTARGADGSQASARAVTSQAAPDGRATRRAAARAAAVAWAPGSDSPATSTRAAPPAGRSSEAASRSPARASTTTSPARAQASPRGTVPGGVSEARAPATPTSSRTLPASSSSSTTTSTCLPYAPGGGTATAGSRPTASGDPPAATSGTPGGGGTYPPEVRTGPRSPCGHPLLGAPRQERGVVVRGCRPTPDADGRPGHLWTMRGPRRGCGGPFLRRRAAVGPRRSRSRPRKRFDDRAASSQAAVGAGGEARAKRDDPRWGGAGVVTGRPARGGGAGATRPACASGMKSVPPGGAKQHGACQNAACRGPRTERDRTTAGRRLDRAKVS